MMAYDPDAVLRAERAYQRARRDLKAAWLWTLLFWGLLMIGVTGIGMWIAIGDPWAAIFGVPSIAATATGVIMLINLCEAERLPGQNHRRYVQRRDELDDLRNPLASELEVE